MNKRQVAEGVPVPPGGARGWAGPREGPGLGESQQMYFQARAVVSGDGRARSSPKYLRVLPRRIAKEVV